MENSTPQRESRSVLVILGGLLLCLCLTVIGAGYVVTTQSQEIVKVFQTQAPRARFPFEGTETVVAATAPAAAATRAAQELQPLVLSESFDSNRNAWDIADFEDDYFSNRERINDGVLRIESKAKKGFFALRSPHVRDVEDFYLSAKVRRVEGATRGEYGITFRSSDRSNFYWFGLDGPRTFFVSMRQDGDWDTLIHSRFSDAIQSDQVNQLAVSGHGSDFDLFINNGYVASFHDERLPRGGIGIGFSLSTQQEATFEFDDVELRAAPTSRELHALETATAWAPTLAARANWQVVQADGFEKTANPEGWYTGSVSSSRTTGTRKVEEGVYRWQLKALQGASWYSIPRGPRFQDFTMRVDARKVGDAPTSFYCAAFRVQDSNNYYRFCVKDSQECSVSVRHNGTWTTIVDWTFSPAIRVGETNRLGVSAVGSQFVFSINDQYVWDLVDYRLVSGLAGVAIEMGQGDETIFEFDNFALQKPAATATPSPTRTPNIVTSPTPSPNFSPTPTDAFVTIPSLVGQSPEQAIEKLARLGLQADVVIELSTKCAGIVTRQETNAGTRVPRNSKIRFFSCRPLTPTPKS